MKSTTKEEDALPGLTICFLKQMKTPNGVWQVRMKICGVSKCLNEEREGVRYVVSAKPNNSQRGKAAGHMRSCRGREKPQNAGSDGAL